MKPKTQNFLFAAALITALSAVAHADLAEKIDSIIRRPDQKNQPLILTC